MKRALPESPISGLDDLHNALQLALEVEHSTIPAYLCAMWSIRPGTNLEAVQILREIVTQEMLHMTLVANVLNAVGGEPHVDDPEFLPRYPATLPHSDGTVLLSLAPFSPAGVDTFMRIERPESVGVRPRTSGYHSLGQFYAAVVQEITRLAGERNIFTGKRAHQVTPGTYFYGGAADVVEVTDLDSALDALGMIVEQGEGYAGSVHQLHHPVGYSENPLAHYYRFQEIAVGRRFRPADTPLTGPTGERLLVDWDAVYPMVPDIKLDDLPPDSAVRESMNRCNRTYASLLDALQRAFTGSPPALLEAVPLMWQLEDQATGLMKVPTGGGRTAGPSFEWPAGPPEGTEGP
jgi:hypothetical protein